MIGTVTVYEFERRLRKGESVSSIVNIRQTGRGDCRPVMCRFDVRDIYDAQDDDVVCIRIPKHLAYRRHLSRSEILEVLEATQTLEEYIDQICGPATIYVDGYAFGREW